ncbi:HAUS augmin-like complex subunit 6 N-terminus-domain-containing protein [Xylariomycetidae sp. FL0641]|nr:HAUS augmin-like complex subunit 6 N-terminus-domain-containing protein [Xylariomycetidae sp. FL0641]
MSSLQSTIARSRSLRVPSKATLTAPQAASSAATSPSVPCSTSNLLLFLTNLRLLDLDHEPDWPDITPATFSAKDAAGGQRKRIQCVEWALYQLFLLWDPEETQNKLRPFFPPLDQVQSINLRAALTRGLEQAKKNGVLGRDAVIRKTMLDECRGERLEEVLAVFSSAVLKKLVAERALNSGPEYRPTVSESLALENRGYSGDRTELSVLLLAHKASLRSALARKNIARERYRDFEQQLAAKEQALAHRRDQATASSQAKPIQVSERARTEACKIIRTNWTGNEKWLDGLLHNGTESRSGGLLGARFSDVWTGVEKGRISDLEDKNAGLLEQLDDRVRVQTNRLEKWTDFRKKMFGEAPPTRPETPKKTKRPEDNGFRLTRHLDKEVQPVDAKTLPPLDSPPPEYARLLQGLQTGLGGGEKPKLPDFSNLLGGIRRVPTFPRDQDHVASPPVAVEPISDLSEWEDEPDEFQQPGQKAEPPGDRNSRLMASRGRQSPTRRHAPKGKAVDTAPVETDDHLDEGHHQPPRSLLQHDPPPVVLHASDNPDDRDAVEAPSSLGLDGTLTQGDSAIHSEVAREDSLLSPPRPASPTQAQADAILASMTNASPSPVKKARHMLSLAERTRMSMTRKPSSEPDDDELEQMTPLKPSRSRPREEPVAETATEQGEEYEDLVARTQRSMAGYEAARQKAQLERRRSERTSKMSTSPKKEAYFPKLDEEAVGDTSIAEELLETPQVDYEAVFRSRPRLAMSPTPSPSPRFRYD